MIFSILFTPTAESVSITPAPTPTVIETIAAVIEDWQLAPRYQRKPMSVEEMEYINVCLLLLQFNKYHIIIISYICYREEALCKVLHD